jgi:hypothetical protein
MAIDRWLLHLRLPPSESTCHLGLALSVPCLLASRFVSDSIAKAPEPLARLYSRNYYRATWINTALDAGFATALPMRPKWIRDLFSMIFSGYYLIYANEAEEVIRRYRARKSTSLIRP